MYRISYLIALLSERYTSAAVPWDGICLAHTKFDSHSPCGLQISESKADMTKPPAGEGERFVAIKENPVLGYFCASARRFTIIPEKRTM